MADCLHSDVIVYKIIPMIDLKFIADCKQFIVPTTTGTVQAPPIQVHYIRFTGKLVDQVVHGINRSRMSEWLIEIISIVRVPRSTQSLIHV